MSERPNQTLASFISEIRRGIESEQNWYRQFHVNEWCNVFIRDYVTSRDLAEKLRKVLALIEQYPELVVESPHQHYQGIAHDRAHEESAK